MFLKAMFSCMASLVISLLMLPGIACSGVEITSPFDGATVGGIVPVVVSYSGTPEWPVYWISRKQKIGK